MLVKKSVFYYNSDVSNGFLSKTIKKKTHTHTHKIIGILHFNCHFLQ